MENKLPLVTNLHFREACPLIEAVLGEQTMTITLSAMEVRQRFGEILNRVDLFHDQFIVERNGRPLAAIVPISALLDIQKRAQKTALAFLDSVDSDLSDEEANEIAVAAVREVRTERRKKKV